MDWGLYITAFVTLFVIIDPIGLAPLFIALTRDMSMHERRRVGWRAVIVAALLLTLFGLAGEQIWAASGFPCPPFALQAAFCCS